VSDHTCTSSEELNALRNKVVLITGGASGLGRDVATQAAARGAKVVLLDVRADRLTEVKAQVEAVGAACLTVQTDVSKDEDVVVKEAQVYRPGQ
jgi:NADP-dependent 3-hydroxy acid dehydrogenase YdfG